jgi:anti-sigma factor RsiW
MPCTAVAKHIARLADDPDALDAQTRATVEGHLNDCASCRAAVDTQRAISAFLKMRPADSLSPQFASRLAARLDDASGWFGIADWQAWTLRLAPVAAALALATYLGLGASTQTPATIEEWTLEATESSAESLLWDSAITAESVMETMLTGELPAGGGGTNDVR